MFSEQQEHRVPAKPLLWGDKVLSSFFILTAYKWYAHTLT